ncbi:hypothetical protein [Tardiphaga sp. vice304]|nr:hypothetical protein [Tardiphaga sp. vice304]
MANTAHEIAPSLIVMFAASLLKAAEQAEQAGRSAAAPRWRFPLLKWIR